jgi:hypothetical protein
MPPTSGKRRSHRRANPLPIKFRIFQDADAEVCMLAEGHGTARVRVSRPVTREKLENARELLMATLLAESSERQSAQNEKPSPSESSRKADKEIRTALNPCGEGGWLTKAGCVAAACVGGFFLILGTMALISMAYRGIEFSSRNFPEGVHLAVLAIYSIALGVGIRVITTGRSRARSIRNIRHWFGPAGLLVLSGMILVAAAAVFASLTFVLYRRGLVSLDPCRGLPVTEPHLLDFYMWHFLKLVPLASIPETLRWEVPLCYSQFRVGLLIVLFQVSTVLPCLATARYYFKNRRKLDREIRWKYVYEPDWSPEKPGADPA